MIVSLIACFVFYFCGGEFSLRGLLFFILISFSVCATASVYK